MADFEFYAPTQVFFGRDTEQKTGQLVRQYGCKKVLVHYGGQSAQKSGLLDRVYASLEEAGVGYLSLGGVVPNPHLKLVEEGIALCKNEGVDFLLAVGGGSVIDSAKAIAYGAVYDGNVWDLYEGKQEPKGALGVGAIPTIAAAGSEMSDSSVITNTELGAKRGLSSYYGRCRFALMNPGLTLTLPAYQTACGCADILLHTLERYFTPYETLELTDSMAEALMRTLMGSARVLTRDPQNYAARAEVMWAGSLSHNGVTGDRAQGDWACHQLGHELSAKWDLAHGAALTAVFGSWARYVYKENPARFARLAETVLELPAEKTEEATALAAIEEIEGFFWSLELPTTIGEAGIELDDALIAELVRGCSRDGKRTIGAFKKLDEQDMASIYTNAK